MRPDGRAADQLREVRIAPNYLLYPEGSALIELGATRVICTASLEEGVPSFLKGRGRGWVTAEYSMIPRATHVRTSRETAGLRGRTQEIRRLIGRSLRAMVDLESLGERTFTVDCDVIQADGGTRTASVTGGCVALALALGKLIKGGLLPPGVLKRMVAAASVGVVDGQACLDLSYEEDSQAEVDLNVVMTDQGDYVEVQGTAEGDPFCRSSMDILLDLAEGGIGELLRSQREALDGV